MRPVKVCQSRGRGEKTARKSERWIPIYVRIQLCDTYIYTFVHLYIYIYIWVGVELGTQRHSKWSENQICSLSPPPTSIATHLPPVCRLHSSHPHLPPYRSPLWPRYRSTLAATLPPRASKARTSTALWSCRQPPSSTLRRRPNSIPHGPQALELKPPFFPFSPPHSLCISIFILKEGTFHFLFEWIFSRFAPPRLRAIGKFWRNHFLA